MTGPGPAGRAALWMLVVSVVGALMAVFIRLAGAELHGFQIAFLRTLFALPLVGGWWLLRRGGPLPTAHWRWHLLRALFILGAMLFLFHALTLAPIGEVTAITLSTPVLSTAGAALILGERVGPHRWTAVAVGFLGALLMVAPRLADGGTTADLGIVLAVVGTLFGVGEVLVLKRLSNADPTGAVVTWLAVLMAPLALGPALAVWRSPSWEALGWTFALALTATAGQVAVTRAFALADVSLAMSYDFIRLVLTAGLGYLLFAETLGSATLTGAALVLAASAYIARREARIKPAPARGGPTP